MSVSNSYFFEYCITQKLSDRQDSPRAFKIQNNILFVQIIDFLEMTFLTVQNKLKKIDEKLI